MHCTVHPFGTQGPYRFAVVPARCGGRWLLCREHGRPTWENPGGHVEPGEDAEAAARRELFEETGALDFDLFPLCDYRVTYRPAPGEAPIEAAGCVFFAEIRRLGPLPQGSEMAEVALMDTRPAGTTYAEVDALLNPLLLAFAARQDEG